MIQAYRLEGVSGSLVSTTEQQRQRQRCLLKSLNKIMDMRLPLDEKIAQIKEWVTNKELSGLDILLVCDLIARSSALTFLNLKPKMIQVLESLGMARLLDAKQAMPDCKIHLHEYVPVWFSYISKSVVGRGETTFLRRREIIAKKLEDAIDSGTQFPSKAEFARQVLGINISTLGKWQRVDEGLVDVFETAADVFVVERRRDVWRKATHDANVVKQLDRLEEIRRQIESGESSGLTDKRDLAARLGVNRDTLRRWELSSDEVASSVKGLFQLNETPGERLYMRENFPEEMIPELFRKAYDTLAQGRHLGRAPIVPQELASVLGIKGKRSTIYRWFNKFPDIILVDMVLHFPRNKKLRIEHRYRRVKWGIGFAQHSQLTYSSVTRFIEEQLGITSTALEKWYQEDDRLRPANLRSEFPNVFVS